MLSPGAGRPGHVVARGGPRQFARAPRVPPNVGDQASLAVVSTWRSDRYTASGPPADGFRYLKIKGGQMALREHAAGTAFPGVVGRNRGEGARLAFRGKRMTAGTVNLL